MTASSGPNSSARSHPPLLEFDFLVSEARVIFASLPSPSWIPAASYAVYVSGVIVFYSFISAYSLT